MSAASLIALYALKPPHEVVCKSSIPHLCPCSHLLLLLISGLNQPSTLHLLFYTLCSGSSHCRDPPAHYILTLSCVRIPNLGPELPLWSHWCWVSGQDRIIFAAVTEQREPPLLHILLQRILEYSFCLPELLSDLYKVSLALCQSLCWPLTLFCMCRVLHLPSLKLRWLVVISQFLSLSDVPLNGWIALQIIGCSLNPILPTTNLISAANFLKMHSVLQSSLSINTFYGFASKSLAGCH